MAPMRRWLVLLFPIGVALAVLECLLRLFPVEPLVSKALYYQQVDTSVYRVSDDPFLQYELRPNATLTTPAPGYQIRINRWGARGPEHPEQKAPGVFRILAFGGSTMFGCNVNDDQAIPAQLESHLNNTSDQRQFEVWNFGASGYAPSQVAHLALREAARFDPDLALVQLYNRGRRPYLLPQDGTLVDFTPYLGDVDTVLENFPPMSFFPSSLHVSLLQHSNLYRAVAAVQRLFFAPRSGMDAISTYGDEISFREMTRLVAMAHSHPFRIVFFTLPGFPFLPSEVAEGLRKQDIIALDQEGREPEFYQVHPPAPILAEWSRFLARRLAELGALEPVPRA